MTRITVLTQTQESQSACDVTLRRVRLTIVVIQKQVLHILSVYL